MNVKLTISIHKEVIEKAKDYAKKNHVSLSHIVGTENLPLFKILMISVQSPIIIKNYILILTILPFS